MALLVAFVDQRFAGEAAGNQVAGEVAPWRLGCLGDLTESGCRLKVMAVVEVGGGDLVAPVVLFQRLPVGLGLGSNVVFPPHWPKTFICASAQRDDSTDPRPYRDLRARNVARAFWYASIWQLRIRRWLVDVWTVPS